MLFRSYIQVTMAQLLLLSPSLCSNLRLPPPLLSLSFSLPPFLICLFCLSPCISHLPRFSLPKALKRLLCWLPVTSGNRLHTLTHAQTLFLCVTHTQLCSPYHPLFMMSQVCRFTVNIRGAEDKLADTHTHTHTLSYTHTHFNNHDCV